MKDLEIKLTPAEASHVLYLLIDAERRGEYSGPRAQYWKRHQRIIDKLKFTPTEQKGPCNVSDANNAWNKLALEESRKRR